MPPEAENSLLEKSEHVLILVERLMRWQTAIIAITAAGVLWGARLEFQLSNHEDRLAKLEHHDEKLTELVATLRSDNLLLRQLVDTMRRAEGANSNKVDIKVGAMAGGVDTDKAERRDYLTTEEAAKLTGYEVRTIQAMCASGEIKGAVQPKGTRGWQIPKDFTFSRREPQTAAVSGTQPQP